MPGTKSWLLLPKATFNKNYTTSKLFVQYLFDLNTHSSAGLHITGSRQRDRPLVPERLPYKHGATRYRIHTWLRPVSPFIMSRHACSPFFRFSAEPLSLPPPPLPFLLLCALLFLHVKRERAGNAHQCMHGCSVTRSACPTVCSACVCSVACKHTEAWIWAT